MLMSGLQKYVSALPRLAPSPVAACFVTVRNIQQRMITPLPKVSTKGTRMRRNRVIPAHLGVTKSWDSRHTGGLRGSRDAADRFFEDIMIRKFIEGTFYERLTSEVIVKRRFNEVIICFFITGKDRWLTPKVYWLKAFGEKMLGDMLGCIVKMEIRTGPENGPLFFDAVV